MNKYIEIVRKNKGKIVEYKPEKIISKNVKGIMFKDKFYTLKEYNRLLELEPTEEEIISMIDTILEQDS